ncbi:MAG: hypothetical protein A2X22_08570 [Bacteroidetes bacterium GWF2_49_14]|nr:MAG: hypothetical protein A2X22_08570 [Bacteroidetes bacterium GWF2_49_14]
MIKMVVTDLDGTLLSRDQKVSVKDFRTLEELGERKIIRVIATGRSPYSFSRVMPPDFPVDYLVFSSGAGVMDFATKEILFSYNLPGSQVREIALKLRSLGVSFKVLGPVPLNHHFVYYENGELHPDFIRRMEFYRGFEKPISFDPPNFGDSCQFLIILPPDPVRFEELKAMFPLVKVIRATSPLDHESIWMEIYHPDVSKARGIEFICRNHHIEPSEVMAIGNDYNDTDMLDFVGHAFLVDNAPEELKARWPVVNGNDDSGVSSAVETVIGASR